MKLWGNIAPNVNLLLTYKNMEMNIYKISCLSDCGSYFGEYLKSVTVTATDEETAVNVAKKWMKEEGKSFIYPQERKKKSISGKTYTEKWQVELLQSDIQENQVIDYLEDSDY